jgi:hypothetical protein
MKVIFNQRNITVVKDKRNTNENPKKKLKRREISKIIENSKEYSSLLTSQKNILNVKQSGSMIQDSPENNNNNKNFREKKKPHDITVSSSAMPNEFKKQVINKEIFQHPLFYMQTNLTNNLTSNNNFLQTLDTNNNTTLEKNIISSNNKFNDENKAISEYSNVVFISPPKKQFKDSRNKTKQKNSSANGFSPKKEINIQIISPQESIVSSSSDQLGIQCMICFRTYINTETKTTSGCKHSFCFSCLSYYFQTQIINGNIQTISELKCPIISCNEYYNIASITNILPNNYISILTNKQKKLNHVDSETSSAITFTIDDIKNLKKNRNEANLITYSNHNVIDVNSNADFFLYMKYNYLNCPKCNGNYLFHKKGLNFLVCLNCQIQYCKYCKEVFSRTHLINKISKNRCKVFFYKEGKEISTCKEIIEMKRKKKCQKQFFEFILICGSFIIFIISGVLWLKYFLGYLTQIHKKRNKCCKICKYIILYILLTIGSIIIIVLSLLSIPYTPLITLF